MAGAASGRSDGQVLVGEWIADERIVAGLIAAAAESAKRRRDLSGLDVEAAWFSHGRTRT